MQPPDGRPPAGPSLPRLLPKGLAALRHDASHRISIGRSIHAAKLLRLAPPARHRFTRAALAEVPDAAGVGMFELPDHPAPHDQGSEVLRALQGAWAAFVQRLQVAGWEEKAART